MVKTRFVVPEATIPVIAAALILTTADATVVPVKVTVLPFIMSVVVGVKVGLVAVPVAIVRALLKSTYKLPVANAAPYPAVAKASVAYNGAVTIDHCPVCVLYSSTT